MSIAVRCVSPWTAWTSDRSRSSTFDVPVQLLDQVVRHGLVQGLAAHDQGHLARMVGEVERRLTGRVAGADEVDVEPVRGAHFAARGAVVDALADQPIEAVDGEATPRDAGGEDQRSRADDVAAVEEHFARRRIDARDGARDQDLRPEPPRLLERATGELVARDAARKSEIVLDPRRRPGLSAGRLALDDDRAQPFGRAVDRRGEAGRPAADDRDVVLVGARRWSAGRGDWRDRAPRAARASVRRRAGAPGDRRPAERGPGQIVASSGASGISQLKEIWLRARNRRRSPHAVSQRWPTTVTRGVGGSAAMLCSPPMRSRASALTFREMSCETAAIA